MGPIEISIIVIVVLIVIGIVVTMIVDKKKGKSSCGCDCSSCKYSKHCDSQNIKKEDECVKDKNSADPKE